MDNNIEIYNNSNKLGVSTYSNDFMIPFIKIIQTSSDEMTDICYNYGKQAYISQDTNIKALANNVKLKTGMNPNSAFMYIYVVKNMLSGTIFKRAINNRALEKYFNKINSEYGKQGLKKAIFATRQHASYRNEFGCPVKSVITLCDKYEKNI